MAETVAGLDASLETTAAQLAAAAGCATPRGITPIKGGGNNRVFRLTMGSGEDLVVKSYFISEGDTRDRLGAEWDFLTYAWDRGIRQIPQPLACDHAAGAALYRFIPGRKPAAEEIDKAFVDRAADFVLALNRAPRGALREASEACFSLSQHLSTVDRRIARLAVLDPASPHRIGAERFVAGRLRPAWARIRDRIAAEMKSLGVTAASLLGPDEICLSPSDFGFHNVLVDSAGHMTFLDFEYAGRDDPAKLICDFFCQPELPVSFAHYDRFAAQLFDGLNMTKSHAARCRALFDAYQIKWVCIILNEFLPTGAARRAFADTGARADRCAVQLAKAEEKLAQIF